MAKLRNTRQKELLEEEIRKFSSFFSADDFFALVRKKDSKIGIATIYRFLAELVKKGEIHSYLCNRRTVYSLDKKSHCHFVCEGCGKVDHLDIKSLDFVDNKVEGSICHFQIDVSGVCKSCLEKR